MTLQNVCFTFSYELYCLSNAPSYFNLPPLYALPRYELSIRYTLFSRNALFFSMKLKIQTKYNFTKILFEK